MKWLHTYVSCALLHSSLMLLVHGNFFLHFLFEVFDKFVTVLVGSFQAIAYMGDDFMFQLFGKYRDMALAVKNPCHLNMAACLIKLNRYEEAIGQCSIVSIRQDFNQSIHHKMLSFFFVCVCVCVLICKPHYSSVFQ